MSFTITPATAARFDDLATILAPKKPGARGCWCLTHYLGFAEDAAIDPPERAETVRAMCGRRVAPGVLAYEEGDVVGWAGVMQRSKLLGFDARNYPVSEDDAWIVHCFRVRAGHGKKGVARALLDGAVEYARSKGASAVEAYPIDARGEKVDRTLAYAGLLDWFIDAGFEVTGETRMKVAGRPRQVVRRVL